MGIISNRIMESRECFWGAWEKRSFTNVSNFGWNPRSWHGKADLQQWHESNGLTMPRCQDICQVVCQPILQKGGGKLWHQLWWFNWMGWKSRWRITPPRERRVFGHRKQCNRLSWELQQPYRAWGWQCLERMGCYHKAVCFSVFASRYKQRQQERMGRIGHQWLGFSIFGRTWNQWIWIPQGVWKVEQGFMRCWCGWLNLEAWKLACWLSMTQSKMTLSECSKVIVLMCVSIQRVILLLLIMLCQRGIDLWYCKMGMMIDINLTLE